MAVLQLPSPQALLTPEDAVLSDELNHASIIDGIRLCKAHKYRYRHLDMANLEAKLQEAQVGQGPGVPWANIGLLLSLPLVKEGTLEEASSALANSLNVLNSQNLNPNPSGPELYSIAPYCLDLSRHLMCGIMEG